MLGRWFFLAVVAICVIAYVKAPGSDAAPAAVTQVCSANVPGTTTVTTSWAKPGAGATQTWYDISLVPGFIWGWFQGYGPLAPAQTAHAIDGVPPGLTFYYRINTLYSNGIWRETASGTFVSGCGGGGGGGGQPPVTGNVTQACDSSNSSVAVTFNWQANAAGSQYLDLSMQNNGWAPGTFVGAGPVGSGQGSFTWYGLAKGATHYWRVNTLTSSGWKSSNTGSFTTLSCLPLIKACVGYMAKYTASGRGECEQIVNGADRNLADCVGKILGYAVADGPKACTRYASSPGSNNTNLENCLFWLVGSSHFGTQACSNYWANG